MSKALSTLALSAAAVALAVGVSATSSTASDGARCRIGMQKTGGQVTLEGFVDAAASISGTYELIVTKKGSGGGSNITQTGEFSASAGNQASLGIVTLGGDGGAYVAKLNIRWNGKSASCSETVRGSL